MIGPRQFSLWYLLAELTCIAGAIGLVRYLYVTRSIIWPQAGWWVAAVVAAVVVPAAIGGLFGQMKNGALAGIALMVIYVVVKAFPFFPQVY